MFRIVSAGKNPYIYLFILLFSSQGLWAQFAFMLDSGVEVRDQGGVLLKDAWTGGLNSGQYSTIDLNGDGDEDLLVFDRSTNKANAYLFLEGEYRYAPEYEALLPEGLDNWVLAVDFNCDGLKDLMSSDPFGIRSYTHILTEDGQSSWSRSEQPLITGNGSATFNLQMNGSDIPGITDLDGDGDLDIIVFNFAGLGRVEYHQNLSIENTGSCGLLFRKMSDKWGDFEECGCDRFVFEEDNCGTMGGRLAHAGAKSIATMDMDGDGDQELFMSQEDCDAYYVLENLGDAGRAKLRKPRTVVTDIPLFPALYFLDLFNDGKQDMMIAPNAPTLGGQTNGAASSLWYANEGSAISPDFQLVQKDFLQDNTIDLGTDAVPSFVDYDGDGDLDLFVSANGMRVSETNVSSLHLYENIGSPFSPVFQSKEKDFGGLSELSAFFLNVKFEDLNGDGRSDMVFAAGISGKDTRLYYKPGQGTSFDFDTSPLLEIPVGGMGSELRNIGFVDINKDGRPDLLSGQGNGSLHYLLNTGSSAAPAFLLSDKAFYGIDISFSERGLSPAVGDLNGDGKKELIITSSSGKLRIFDAFLDHLGSPGAGQDQVWSNTLLSGQLPTRLGARSWPTVGDLYANGTASIVVGSRAGGLSLLKSTTPVVQDDQERITLFPNPLRYGPGRRSINIAVSEDTSFLIIDRLGREVLPLQVLSAGDNTVLEVDGLASGMYLVLAMEKGRAVYSSKFIILK